MYTLLADPGGRISGPRVMRIPYRHIYLNSFSLLSLLRHPDGAENTVRRPRLEIGPLGLPTHHMIMHKIVPYVIAIAIPSPVQFHRC